MSELSASDRSASGEAPRLPARRALLIAAVASLGLAACGKKGPLEPAPGSRDALAAEAAKKAQGPAQADTTPQVGIRRSRRPPKVTPPKDEPFLLDFLL